MRILIIWAESITKPGAGTTHCLGLVRGLQSLGHDVTVLAPHYADQEWTRRGMPVRPLRLPRKSLWSFLFLQFMVVFRTAWWTIRYRPEVIYVRTCFFQGVMAVISRIFGVPLVGEVDGLVDQEILARGQPHWMASLVRGLDRVNNRLSSGLVCVSEGLRREMICRGARSETAWTLHNGAMTDIMRPADRATSRENLGLPEDRILIGFAGSFTPWQGLDFLVEAIAIAQQQLRGKALVLLMGRGEVEDAIREQARVQGVENLIQFLPMATQERVAEFLNACDACVIPIHHACKLGLCSPLKFWDSISVGLPVIVAQGLEVEDVLAELGLPGVFDPNCPESLADLSARLTNDDAQMYHI